MRNLIVINGTTFPTPEGGFDVSYSDVLNKYESESGDKTVEIIKSDVANISISYKGLTEADKNTLIAVLSNVNIVTFDNRGTSTTKSMLMTGLSEKKVYFKNDVAVWALSFNLEEL